ncbi:unnamed protein product [Larinioides sclopetarius]|uniref:Uncharacterized protein n=1 Tax=Larinioides sclopetarius TaxID=280406 RepID=A0AAV1YZC2_9ARAC
MQEPLRSVLSLKAVSGMGENIPRRKNFIYSVSKMVMAQS